MKILIYILDDFDYITRSTWQRKTWSLCRIPTIANRSVHSPQTEQLLEKRFDALMGFNFVNPYYNPTHAITHWINPFLCYYQTGFYIYYKWMLTCNLPTLLSERQFLAISHRSDTEENWKLPLKTANFQFWSKSGDLMNLLVSIKNSPELLSNSLEMLA